MKKIFKYIKRWSKWRKHSIDNWRHKFFVLIGLEHSPLMDMILITEDEMRAMADALIKCFEEGGDDKC